MVGLGCVDVFVYYGDMYILLFNIFTFIIHSILVHLVRLCT